MTGFAKKIQFVIIVFLLCLHCFNAQAARAKIATRKAEPYLGSIVADSDTGKIVSSRNSDISCYPASLVKLMVLLIIQEKIEDGSLNLTDSVMTTAEASRMGGSQVYLAENEVFSIEDLLYALIIQSANDAAVALAIHVAGSKEAFVNLMQQKARKIGMNNTDFQSVHGLPPSTGQKPDTSTPEDLAKLAIELLKHPDILKYTSTEYRGFRNNTFDMRSHNRLLKKLQGCDGLKTGYFRAGGYSIIATAKRNDKRLVIVVTGAVKKDVRDAKAIELASNAFSSSNNLNQVKDTKPVLLTSDKNSLISTSDAEKKEQPAEKKPGRTGLVLKRIFILLILVAMASIFYWIGKSRA